MIKVKYTGDRDASGKPTRAIGPEDRQIISLEPKFKEGFSTRVAYKSFDLNVITAFRCGGKLISTLHHSNGYLNMLTGRRGQVDVDYWTPAENKGCQVRNRVVSRVTIRNTEAHWVILTLLTLESAQHHIGLQLREASKLTRMGVQSLRLTPVRTESFIHLFSFP